MVDDFHTCFLLMHCFKLRCISLLSSGIVDGFEESGQLSKVDSTVGILVDALEPSFVLSGGETLGNEAFEEGLDLFGGKVSVLIGIELFEDGLGEGVPVRHLYFFEDIFLFIILIKLLYYILNSY